MWTSIKSIFVFYSILALNCAQFAIILQWALLLSFKMAIIIALGFLLGWLMLSRDVIRYLYIYNQCWNIICSSLIYVLSCQHNQWSLEVPWSKKLRFEIWFFLILRSGNSLRYWICILMLWDDDPSSPTRAL